VTVCVAAICTDDTVIGASDRMITSGDIQFEPPQTKIINISTSIAVMIAGDTAIQTEVLYRTRADVARRIEAQPEEWWRVSDVAELYRKYYNEAVARRSEQAILAPLGLTHATFLAQQRGMSPQLVRQIATELLNFEAPAAEVIISGVDNMGLGDTPMPHIYVVSNGRVSCQDVVGFAAIGAGYWHAESQFMFARHTRAKPPAESLLLTYAAKKRAEVAPGVGGDTDMFIVGPTLGSYVPINPNVLLKLEEIYQSAQSKHRSADFNSIAEVNHFVEELIAAGAAAEQEQETTPREPDKASEEKDTNLPATKAKKEGQ
jgi:hypothetical protein